MKELTLVSTDKEIALSSHFLGRLEFAKSRVDALESFRIQSALRNCSEPFQHVFSLLPLLVQCNHPLLPAYVKNTPCGIAYFELTSAQQQYLNTLSNNFSMDNQEPAFDGMYLMGSIGSITQTSLSDLDLWLCYSKTFSSEQKQSIENKLAKIKLWAGQLGIEVNFYLMNSDAFKAHQYNSGVTEEHNGSAQHFLLLDEFYRSAIRLAGKRILWTHIADDQQDYQFIIQQAQERGELDLSEWIDFGDFSSLPLGEYFGASLWQLYKGIESPYKSAIKIMLLETYAETYPETNLISKKFKTMLLATHSVSYHFDPYLAMLEKVTTYLENRKEFGRLDRLRNCFYIKASDGQNDIHRKQVLNELVAGWGWSAKEIEILDNRKNWKIKQAMLHQQMIVEQLLQSYRNLIHFARKFHIDPSIMPQDTDILMRKLYSVFEEQPGKILLINENIATKLAESEVTFIEVGQGLSTKAGWYMINHAPLSSYDSTSRHVQYQKELGNLVAWAYFNGIITASTHIHLVSQTVSLVTLRQFITDLRLSFPVKAPAMRSDDLYHPHEIRNLIVAINLMQDPTRNIPPYSKEQIAQVDLFNLSSSEPGVIGSINIIYRNMWNEVLTKHFEGNDALLKALKFISNKIYRSSAPPHSVNIFSYSRQLRNELQKIVMGLVNRCITVQTGSIYQRQQLQTFNIAGKQWQLVFDGHLALKEIQVVEQQEDKEGCCVTKINTLNVAIPKEIYSFASEGFLQFFFEDNEDDSFNVYVLDKQNHSECYRYCCGEKEAKVKQISKLYSEEFSHRAEKSFESFNFPQFYQLLKSEDTVSIVPFQSKRHRDYIEQQAAG
ncbi:class I adenylate cyclase [Glaesserella sp.]|uniref:class I adenylate cyclase n=1 Tax=Glaesserella sp. TaxID=2094731 RepID=UPI0035A13B0C